MGDSEFPADQPGARRCAARYGQPTLLLWGKARELPQRLPVPGDPRFFPSSGGIRATDSDPLRATSTS
jgi:hypothetical protein